VPLVVDKDGVLKPDTGRAKKYNSNVTSVYGYTEAFGNVG